MKITLAPLIILLFVEGHVLSSDDGERLDTNNVDLCDLFGGVCQTSSCLTHQLRHKWGVGLCMNDEQRCCTQQPRIDTQVAGTVTGQINECVSNGGSCHLWYYFNRCSGRRSSSPCHHRWYSCCLPDTSAQSVPTTTETLTTTLSQTELVTRTTRTRTRSAQCGRMHTRRRHRRIVGGSITGSARVPWHVGIRTALGNIVCGAVMINTNWCLTAAHCLKGITDTDYLRVVSGDDIIDASTTSSYPIQSFYRHPNYEEIADSSNHAHKNDIALIKLTTGAVFSRTVQPACLPGPGINSQYTSCYITGWGAQSSEIEMSVRLRKVSGPVINSTACSRFYLEDDVDENMICFGDSNRGACTGDSGGGLFCSDSSGKVSVQGIISWGSASCNQSPTVLTNVTKYQDWIERTMTNSITITP